MNMMNSEGSAQHLTGQPIAKPLADEQRELSKLHLSRRLDWRFLLPDPSLANVGCVGTVDPKLMVSLALFAESVTKLPAAVDTDIAAADYDLIVAGLPTFSELGHAVKQVRSGGYLYVETCGLLWPRQLSSIRGWQDAVDRIRLWNPQAYIAELVRLGMHGATAYWFWPNFAACTRMVPLDDPTAFRFVFGTDPKRLRLRRRAMATVQSAVVTNRWLNLFLPSLGIIASK